VRVISLFSGTGAFELGFERAGFTTVGQCEIDPHAQAVLKRHWPTVPLHGDITTLKGDAFGPAEVVVWGSPCQGLSLAGRRAGLEDERSGLFTEGIRFIRELRHATNNQYPRFSVWENVPGAFSSNAGRDFRAVLEAFLEAEVPMPRSGKWANAGVVRGNGREVAWRVLDSQHFGVAQRRRRVFVVTDLGGQRAAEVLFECEGVPGHPPKGRAPGQGITGALTGGASSSSAGNVDDNRAQAGFVVPVLGISQELDAEAELIGTLKRDSPTGGGSKPMVAVAPFDLAQITSPHNRNKVEFGAPANPLTASGFSDPCVALAFAENTRSEVRLEGGDGQRTGALSTGGGKPGQGQPVVAFAMRGRAEGNVPEASGERVSALRGSSGGSTRDMVATRYAVRRLMPVETERLQGMPDGWTELGHYVEQATDRDRLWNAKERRRPTPKESDVIIRKIADTHRYRLCGNAVTVNVAEWLGHRVAAALAAEELEDAA